MCSLSNSELDIKLEELSDCSSRLLEDIEGLTADLQNYYPQLLQVENAAVESEEIKQKVGKLDQTAETLRKAASQLYEIRDELSARWNDIQRSRRKIKILAPPANMAIDMAEETSKHFAKGLNGYKLLLICFFGSFFGVMVETLWCLVTRGKLMSRAGLVYGPFNLLYGTGAVVLTIALYRFRNRGGWLSFLGGMITGSALEYLCSLAQELILGSRSWDYSNVPFNLNGRICLLYSVFWGALGMLWIKNVYPRLIQWILKIPNRAGKIVVWAFTAFFVLNAFVSATAVYRWSQRISGAPAQGRVWELVDERFPDERMEAIFPSMAFQEK